MADTHYNLTHQNGNVAHVEKATWRQTQRLSLYLLWARRQTLHQFGQQQSILSLFLPLALSICLCSLNFEKTRLHMTMQLKFHSRTYIPDISDYSIPPVVLRHISKSWSDAWLRITQNRAMATILLPFPPSFAKWNKVSHWAWPSPYLSACTGPGFEPQFCFLISHANTLLLILIYLNMDHTTPLHITEQNKEENKMQIT